MKTKRENEWKTAFVYKAAIYMWENRNQSFLLGGKEDPSVYRSGQYLISPYALYKQREKVSERPLFSRNSGLYVEKNKKCRKCEKNVLTPLSFKVNIIDKLINVTEKRRDPHFIVSIFFI
ncbi:hypothetical protein COL87_09250 [Bacillus pseudomycoides]|uniref:Uncharacterized protein n=1 Tax=Bacillus pseudomycoides TaxID=64104 RepID=A0A2C5AX82_9BACI|nr:hypothetical protein [Bacillus pseudomycoides]MDR4328901.1 hypothetical protein [Bacillus pseudomycoides]PEF73372.1 hypothetical protein CON94_21115 [Bacillus pseudomycoides]PEI39989.1 hypothetical protein CN641_25650 [Bacillus pseudomycoides]PEJ21397.1 hypothetical protein CN887_25460 [Bacillus pseudomycoides]